MEDAAHAELLQHKVYHKPFKVEPTFEFWKTPSEYHRRNLEKEKLPDSMKVWRVQNSGKTYGSVVARSYGFTDSPDAEILAVGFNHGKEYGAVGVGRHGNFLQWGYSSPPSQMTKAGKKFFLNCIAYINQFDGKTPLIRKTSSHRMNAIRLAEVINRVSNKEDFFNGIFPKDLWVKYSNDPEGLMAYYRSNLEWIYRPDVFLVDADLKLPGIESNRTLSSLEKIINLLDNQTHAETAMKLLKRYTNESFQTSEQWRSWFENNRDRIFFSDVGGYKFFVIPEGYLENK